MLFRTVYKSSLFHEELRNLRTRFQRRLNSLHRSTKQRVELLKEVMGWLIRTAELAYASSLPCFVKILHSFFTCLPHLALVQIPTLIWSRQLLKSDIGNSTGEGWKQL